MATHTVKLTLSLGSDSTVVVTSDDRNLAQSQGTWTYTLPKRGDLVQLEIEDIAQPGAASALVNAFETRGDGNLVQWTRDGSVVRSSPVPADIDLDVLFMAVSVASSAGSTQQAPGGLLGGSVEPIQGHSTGGHFKIRDTGGGDPTLS